MCELEPVVSTDVRFCSLVSELACLTSVVSGLVLDGTAYGDAWSECRLSCEGLVHRARALLAETVKVSDECSKAGFREWVRGDGGNDSKNAFQFSRMPVQWCPDPVTSKDRVFSRQHWPPGRRAHQV